MKLTRLIMMLNQRGGQANDLSFAVVTVGLDYARSLGYRADNGLFHYRLDGNNIHYRGDESPFNYRADREL